MSKDIVNRPQFEPDSCVEHPGELRSSSFCLLDKCRDFHVHIALWVKSITLQINRNLTPRLGKSEKKIGYPSQLFGCFCTLTTPTLVVKLRSQQSIVLCLRRGIVGRSYCCRIVCIEDTVPYGRLYGIRRRRFADTNSADMLA